MASYNLHMDFLGVMSIDVGILFVLFGLVSLCKPLALIKITTRRRAWTVILAGVVAIATGTILPIRETRVASIRTHLDELVPVYQFHESHHTTVTAPADRVYAAIKEVEPDEILGYRALTWARRFGRSGRPNILNPPPHQPLLQTALQTGFLQLGDDPAHEYVFGFDASPLFVSKPTAERFKATALPFSAKVAMNFRVEPIDANHCTLTTETRVYGSDADVQHFFAPYWRLIYPGSALMRRMWLRAIRERAERSPV